MIEEVIQMNSTPITVHLIDSVAKPLEHYANQTHASVEQIILSFLQWTFQAFEQRLEEIQSKFEVKQLEWFKEHIDILALRSVSHPGELVQLLQRLWRDSSFEEETDLDALFDALLTLSADDLLMLSWWIAQNEEDL